MKAERIQLFDTVDSAGEIVVLSVPVPEDLKVGDVQDFIDEQVGEFIDENSYPEDTGSPYDCTGKNIRSSWEVLDMDCTNEGWVIVYKHTWVRDI